MQLRWLQHYFLIQHRNIRTEQHLRLTSNINLSTKFALCVNAKNGGHLCRQLVYNLYCIKYQGMCGLNNQMHMLGVSGQNKLPVTTWDLFVQAI